MFKYFPCALIGLLFHLSCHPKEEHGSQNTYGPKVVEAHGYVVPQDSMEKPTIILVDESKLKKFLVGKPTVVLTNTNIFPAGTPKVVVAGIPRVCTPGRDSFSLPKTVPAIDSPFVAGIPEMVVAKDAATKDNNSQNFSSFNKLQGLKSSAVFSMLQDNNGNLWLGTGGGASKYDGKSFTHFTKEEGLSHDAVISTLQDNSGNIWFGTNGGGVSKYDGKSFTQFSEKEGLNNNVITSMLEDKSGNLWFGTNGAGVSKYDGKSFTQFSDKEGLGNNAVSSILEDKSGNLWFGTGGGGVSKYDGKSFTHFTDEEGLSNNFVLSMLEDKSGNLWFGTYGSGVSKYDGKSFIHFTDKEGLSNNFVLSILEDKSGNLWFGTGGGGVSKYDGKSFTHFTDKEGLSNNLVLSILEDKSGNLWFGTAGGGVSKYDGNSFTHFTDKEGLSNSFVISILEDKNGNLWLVTADGGVSKYDGISFTNFTGKERLGNNFILCMRKDKNGNLWFGTDGEGVSKYDGISFTHFTDKEGLSNNFVMSILEDKGGNLWFGTNGGGVSKYDGISFTQFTDKEGLSNNFVRCMLEDKSGNLWFGTYGGGVSTYDGKSFTHFTDKEGLSNNFVLSILEDKSGSLWFGTDGGGVSLYDGKSFTHFTDKEGLSNNAVSSILEDKSGNLWFGTRFGLSKFAKVKLVEFFEKVKSGTINESDVFIKTYTYEDGFLGIGCITNSICEDKNGTIWISTNDMLTAYHPPIEGITIDTIGPNIQLTSISLYNETVAWTTIEQHKDSTLTLGNGVQLKYFEFAGTTKWYGLPEDLSLAYNNNYPTFNFIGITMNQPKKVKYQYKLEGLDDNWSALTTRTEATYGNLPPRNYVFKVKAMNSEGYWSNEFHYPFIIRPPWWATWWAYSLYVLLMGSFVYILYRSRIRQLENKQAAQIKTMVATQEEERKRISRDLHDDIGTKLSALNLFLSSLSEKASDTHNKELKSLAESSEQLIKETMQDVRQLLLNLSPTVLEEFGYTTAVEGLINKFNDTKQIHFNLVVFGMKQRLKKDYELALYRITQELINNVLKHAQAKHVSLQIGQRDEKIILMIEDDGLGFDVQARNEGYGLNNLNARTKLLHGTMAIDSHPGKGTSVLIEIPYHSNGQ